MSGSTLEDELVRYAERPGGRGAESVLAGAVARAAHWRRRRRALVGVAVILVLASAVTAIVSRGTDSDRVRVSTRRVVPAPGTLPLSIDVVGRSPDVLGVAVGRLWVATTDEPPAPTTTVAGETDEVTTTSTLHAYDVTTGRQVGVVRLPAPPYGALVEAAGSLVVRISTGGPATFPANPGESDGNTNEVVRIDPRRYTATPLRGFGMDGQIAGNGRWIAVTNLGDLTVLDLQGSVVSTTSVTALADAAPPGAAGGGAGGLNGIVALGFDGASFDVVDQALGLLVSIDPATGQITGRRAIDPGGEVTSAIISGEHAWVSTRDLDGSTGVGVVPLIGAGRPVGADLPERFVASGGAPGGAGLNQVAPAAGIALAVPATADTSGYELFDPRAGTLRHVEGSAPRLLAAFGADWAVRVDRPDARRSTIAFRRWSPP